MKFQPVPTHPHRSVRLLAALLLLGSSAVLARPPDCVLIFGDSAVD